jgi:hypothetical protein
MNNVPFLLRLKNWWTTLDETPLLKEIRKENPMHF